MPRDNSLIQNRNAKIIAIYNQKSNQGVKEWKIYKHLRENFFLTNRMLDYIISGNFEKYKNKQPQENPNQLTIFSNQNQ